MGGAQPRAAPPHVVPCPIKANSQPRMDPMSLNSHLNPAPATRLPAGRRPEWMLFTRRALAAGAAVLVLALGPQGPAQAQARRASSRRHAAARRPSTRQQLAQLQQPIDRLQLTIQSQPPTIQSQQQHIERLEQFTNSQNEALTALNQYTHTELTRVTQGLNEAIKTVNQNAQAAIQQLHDQ